MAKLTLASVKTLLEEQSKTFLAEIKSLKDEVASLKTEVAALRSRSACGSVPDSDTNDADL